MVSNQWLDVSSLKTSKRSTDLIQGNEKKEIINISADINKIKIRKKIE